MNDVVSFVEFVLIFDFVGVSDLGAPYIAGVSTSCYGRARISRRGYNRWFLAWTLMKNPGLISRRAKGRSASRPVYSVNFTDCDDDQMLIP